MRITTTQPLFAWNALEDSPSLATVRELPASIPDARLLESLRGRRGHGRDDYPVSVLWGVVVLTIALRHPGIEACLAELKRNRGLRELIGIESERGVPKKWNMSRFLDVLGREPHLTLGHEVFEVMIQRLGGVVIDLGRDTAGDASGLNARGSNQNRSLWKDQTEQLLPGHEGSSNIVYDEAGTVYCYDKVSDPCVRHQMAYLGHEPQRGTLKYRCPARHEGWKCPSDKVCNAGKTYGLTVRVKREIDLRRFPPIPRATKQFERKYKGRTAVERINARLKMFWGADDGNITGARRFHAFLGAVMVVHAAFATVLAAAPRREGTLGRMRLSPPAQALRQKLIA